MEEIRRIITRLKKGRSPGLDAISAEMISSTLEVSLKKLHKLFNEVWKKEKIPHEWRKSLIVKIPKKGDLTVCDNYRGISLLSVPGKIFCRILIDCIRNGVDETLRQEQAGFRRGRSTCEHIFTLRNILEQCMEWQAPVYMNFVDFSKAFDSIIREKIWEIMKEYGIPVKYIDIIRDMYTDSCSCVVEGSRSSEWFEVKSGVRQGCAMSGFIFVLVMDWIMKNTNNQKRGIWWNFTTILEDLDYADDLVLISSRYEDMKSKSERLYNVAAATGMKINFKKTKTLRMNCKNQETLKLEGEEIEDVDNFIYLGAVVDKHGGTERDINRRLSLARNAFVTLRPVWKSAKYSTVTKIRLFNSNVMPVLLYGAEMWRVTAADNKKLDVFQRTCLRRILRVFWPQTISNDELYSRTGATPVSETLKTRRWKWIGHILRREKNNHARVALTWAPEGKRKRGKPRTTWRRTVEKERELMGWTSWGKVAELAADRTGWRHAVHSLMHPQGREEDK